jgi:hypothetical protein
MITDFCVICGTKDDLHVHHIVCKKSVLKPVSGDYDDPTNLITLCVEHHGWIHGLKPNRFNNHHNLIRNGVERAKKEGKYKGRAPTARRKQDQIKLLHNQGMRSVEIAEELNIGVASVYRYRT